MEGEMNGNREDGIQRKGRKNARRVRVSALLNGW
jgi:hypothetical protein